MMIPDLPLSAHPLRGITLAAVTFLAGLTIGTLAAPEIAGRQVMADTPAAVPPLVANPRTTPGTHPAEVLRVLDGDTFEARMRVWPGIEITSKVRLRGIDAPELKARCPEERTKAEVARDALRTMLAEGGVAVTHVGLDKYGGRVLADAATRATPDIGASMLAKGLVRVYGGGRRETWCNGT
jgi:endonuclease YncB( thermonuclease family)